VTAVTVTGPTEEQLRAAAGDDPAANAIVDLWVTTKREVEEAMQGVLWAEDEITQAQARHPHAADLLWHSWWVIMPGSAFPYTEFMWRGHMRELLDRVGAGQDTRPGTRAEFCVVAREASALAPLSHDACGAYFRAWHEAFPGNPVWDTMPDEVAHGYRWNDNQIRDIIADVRAKIGRRMASRRVPRDTACDGVHHGRPTVCRFTAATLTGTHLPLPAPPRKPKTRKRRPPPLPGARQLDPALLDNPAGDGLAAEVAALVAEITGGQP
jgi:hypothetical protein